ncbi:MAG: 16S rRNA (guanine(527)-N(7))-methyltransferase RsmG [Kangiellaceae bacterium]|nr:16S rRNA (guanine(527)-N(7))-methyltransferase RsmG [Kangiellaceae bacterium]
MGELRSALQQGLSVLDISSTSKQIDSLVELVEHLLKWNKAYNLTSIKDPGEVLSLHLLDSLAVLPHINQKNIIDVGTGPGFPGLPLAIMLPEVKFTLLDSNSKKIRFIRQVIHHLNIENVEVVHSRVEDFKGIEFDAVISRAFASISDMVILTRHLLSDGGVWLAMKGQSQKEVLDYHSIGVEKVVEIDLSIPNLKAERCLIKLQPC